MADETERTRGIVEGFYRDYADGRSLEGARETFAPNIDFEICVPAYLFEFAGPRKGADQATEALRALAERYEVVAFEPHMMIVEGERACVYSSATVRGRGGGPQVTVELCDLLRLKDGRIVWFREFFDAATAAAGMFGGPTRAI